MWKEVVVTTDREAHEAVCNFLHEAGAGGVVIEDPALCRHYTNSGEWDAFELPAGSLEGENVTVKAYFPADESFPEKLSVLEAKLDKLELLFDCRILINLKEIASEEWADSWKKYYRAEKVSNQVVVAPMWEHCRIREDEILVRLDPGLAFGTGKHPSTILCIHVLEKLVRNTSCVFDVGTGSGILAITAAKMGAKQVLAIDKDPVAVKVARMNVAANQVADRVEVREGNLLDEVSGQAEIIVANIVADVIIDFAPQAFEYLFPKGYLIASGIIAFRLEEVRSALTRLGLELYGVKAQEDWYALVARKR